MKKSHLSEVFRYASVDGHLLRNDEKLKKLSSHVDAALNELSCSLSAVSINALNSALNIECDHVDWTDTQVIDEMQAVIMLADLLKFLLYTDSNIKERMSITMRQ